jgi:catechol 2,3-dioxygenase-like lactoylglutathione lyase family enzyme
VLRLINFFIIGIIATSAAFAQPEPESSRQLESVAPVLSQPFMNVFRRFSADQEEMYKFYGKILGFRQSNTFKLGGNTSMAWFQVGEAVVKLTGVVPNRKYQKGNVPEATGVRLLTFFFPDRNELMERFKVQGFPAPVFHPVAGSNRSSALVQDPDGQWVELVTVPDAPPSTYEQIEIGLVVSDMETSREFYREFVGLEELPFVEDTTFNTRKYLYRHGATLISLRSFGKGLPADTGSGGIQYVVSDVKAVDALAKARKVTIDQPLNTMQGYALQTIWIDDPDGITNYFAQTGVRGPKAGR